MTKFLKQIISISILALSLPVFAVNCNKTGAYADGYNDARTGMPINLHYADSCPTDIIWVTERAYIKGYKAAANTTPTSPQQCVTNLAGQQACGYNCVHTSFKVQCAGTPDQMCLVNQTGDMACGYNCISNVFGVKCASKRDETCLSSPYGHEIQCGRNCRTVNQSVVCDQS